MSYQTRQAGIDTDSGLMCLAPHRRLVIAGVDSGPLEDETAVIMVVVGTGLASELLTRVDHAKEIPLLLFTVRALDLSACFVPCTWEGFGSPFGVTTYAPKQREKW